jgi:hypothetical protein
VPNDPRAFRILTSLRSALEAVTVDTGYHFDVDLTAVKLDPNHDVAALVGEVGKRPFFVIDPAPERREYQPAFRVKIVTPITIHAVVESDPAIDEDWLRKYTQLVADVERAIAVDITRGALAVDTRVITNEPSPFGGKQVWAMVRTEVIELRTYGAPNT